MGKRRRDDGADAAYEREYARVQGREDAKDDVARRRAGGERRGGLLGGCLAVFAAVAVCCGLPVWLAGVVADKPEAGKRNQEQSQAGRTPPSGTVPPAPGSATPSGPAEPATPTGPRPAVAMKERSGLGDASVTVLTAAKIPVNEYTNVVIITDADADDKLAWAARWVSGREAGGPTLRAADGTYLRRITEAPILKLGGNKESSQAMVMFDITGHAQDKLTLELPVPNAAGRPDAKFRFEVDTTDLPVMGTDSITRPDSSLNLPLVPAVEGRVTFKPLELEKTTPRAKTAGPRKPKPPDPAPKPNATIVPTPLGETGLSVPVPLGRSGADLDRYDAISAEEFTKNGRADYAAVAKRANVDLAAEPTPAVVESERDGLAYLRPTEGPAKGQLRVVRAAAVKRGE